MPRLLNRLSRTLRPLIGILLWIVPPKRLTVVYSISAFEGNAGEVVRWLETGSSGQIVWLLDEIPSQNSVRAVSGTKSGASAVVSKRSFRGFWYFLRADTVLFTDLVFGGPKPPRNRTFVNLWHGDGPKVDTTAHFSAGTPAQFTVAGTIAWGTEKLKSFNAPSDGLIVSGNPRIDQFDRPASDDQLRALGIDPDRPFVLWAPTYRHTRLDSPHGAWKDSRVADPFDEVRIRNADLAKSLAHPGLQLVVKSHPLDKANLDFAATIQIANDDLASAGVGLYQVLARASALLTDYSSIWTDFIPLNRPIALYCPDLDDFSVGRGFDLPDFESYSPGPILSDADDLFAFLGEIAAGIDSSQSRRMKVVKLLGIVDETGATSRLMSQLSSWNDR
ncbi:MAG: CDP-glycerol glycerophosphotransferase family protein [Actinobacteria bacterium]|nr:CDP-glycerol glycerophosphotransferase family protein [Actinomycetota bacterium]